MIRYIAAAAAFKCVSCCALSRRAYRAAANTFGGKRRATGPMPSYYADRVRRIVRLAKSHSIVRDGDRVLELGTGWLHWEALTLRLFYDIEAVLFDVWDNRQLEGLKNYLGQLGTLLDSSFGLTDHELQRARLLIDDIKGTRSFDDLYTRLNFKYVTEPAGDLSQFSDQTFQMVVSAGMLEHVRRDAVPALIAHTKRVLKPDGWAIHSIDTSDHFSHFDARVSPKRYLAFSDLTWKYCFESDIQYINRVQRGEWLTLFRAHGFEVVDEDRKRVDIAPLRIAPRFAQNERTDLETTLLRLALRA